MVSRQQILSYLISVTLHMAPLTSIRTSGGKLEIVNQLLLPHTIEFLEVTTVADAHDAIKTMKVSLSLFQVRVRQGSRRPVDSRSTSYSFSCISIHLLPFVGSGGEFSGPRIPRFIRCPQSSC